MKTYIETIKMACTEKINDGIAAMLAGYLLEVICLLPLLLLWQTLAADGTDLGGLTLPQLLTYTCLSIMLKPQLDVRTPAASWHYDGYIISLYQRPQGIFGQLTALTIGGWIPRLLLFSLPLAILVAFLGIFIIPATLWFWPCLLLSISLGFAVDHLFTCFVIRLQYSNWLALVIRASIVSLLSGAVIPFDLLPFHLGDLFMLLPFGSLAGAPLAVFIGTGSPGTILVLQIFWNLLLWPLAIWAFARSRERMVSYGG